MLSAQTRTGSIMRVHVNSSSLLYHKHVDVCIARLRQVPKRANKPLSIALASREQAALLDQIGKSGTSQELYQILLDNEAYILSDDTTVYLSMAWDLLLHRHCSTIQRNKDLQGFMMQHTMPNVNRFKPSEISMIARAMVATRTGAAADIVHISSDIQTRMVQFAPKELCMVLWALSSHPGMSEKEKHSLFKSLAGLVKEGMGMGNFTAQDLSILVWSLGQAGFRDDALLRAAESESASKIDSFSTEDISRLMHGFACVGYNPHALFVSITQTYQDRLDEFSAQDLALFVVSLGKLVVEPPTSFCKSMTARAKDLVPTVTTKRTSSLNTSDMLSVHLNALILWSFARLGLKKTSFSTKSIKFVNANIAKHDAEDLVAVMWACCRLDIKIDPGHVTEFSSRLLDLFITHRENPGCICRGFRYLSLLWNANTRISKRQTLKKSDEAVLEQNVKAIIQEMFGKSMFLDNITNWERTSVIIALGGFTFLFEKNGLDPAIMRSIQNRITSLDVEASLLPKLAFTIAKLHLESPAVIENLSKTIIYKAGVIPLGGLVQIAYSYASFSSYSGKKQDVSRAISKRLVGNLDSISSRDKARAAFAFFRLGKQDTISRKILESLDEREIAGLEPSSLYGLFIALPASNMSNSLRHALVGAALEHVNSFTNKQLLAIQKILEDTRGTSTSSGPETNLDKLIRARTTALG